MNRPLNEEERANLFLSEDPFSALVFEVENLRSCACKALATTDIMSEESRHLQELIRVCEGFYVRTIDKALELANNAVAEAEAMTDALAKDCAE